MLMNDPSTWELLRDQGAKALQSGAVTPEEAQDAVSSLSPLLRAAGMGKRSPLLGAKRSPAMPTVGDGMDLPNLLDVPGVKKGSGLGGEQSVRGIDSATSTVGSKDTAQTLQFMDQPQLQKLYDSTAALPTFQDQAEGLRTQRDLLNIASRAPTDSFSGPIAGLLESEFGRKTGTMANMRGLQPTTQANNILSMSGKIQDDQKDLSKSIFDAIGKEKSGYSMTSLSDQLALKSIIDQFTKKTETDPAKNEKAAGKGYTPDKDVKELGKALAPYAPTLNTMNKLDQLIGGMDNWSGKNIPGAGFLGRLAPSGMLTDKGSQIQQTYRELQEELLKLYNGARITQPEYQRLSQALGANVTGGDREFVNGLKRFRSEFKDTMAQKEAPYRVLHPEVVNIYHKGGGQTSDTAFPGVAPTAPAKPKMSYDEWVKAGKPKAGQ